MTTRDHPDEDRGRRSDQGLHERRGTAIASSEVMAELARSLQRGHASLDDTLASVTAAAVGGVPGAEFAGITLVRRGGKLENRAATAEMIVQLDRAQSELAEGPCVDSIWTSRTVRIDDMRTDPRWPQFAAHARDLGVLASLSLQLFVQADTVGSLNLYSTRLGAFDVASEDIGLVFAAHAALALVEARRESSMRAALSSRDLIGQAKGILMERYGLDAQQAFTLLAQVSQRTNVPVRDVADHLALTGAVEPFDDKG